MMVDNLADSILKMGLIQPGDAAGRSSKTSVPEEPIPKAMGPQSSHVDSASNASVNSDSATLLRSPIPNPSLSGNAVKVDISCSVPEPICQFLSNLSSSNSASSSQLPANLTDLISLVPEPLDIIFFESFNLSLPFKHMLHLSCVEFSMPISNPSKPSPTPPYNISKAQILTTSFFYPTQNPHSNSTNSNRRLLLLVPTLLMELLAIEK